MQMTKNIATTSHHKLIKPATVDDLPGILAIYNEAIRTTTAVFQYEPHTLEMRQRWFEEKQAAGYPILTAELDGAVVGFANLGPWRQAAAYKYCVENSVYVAEAYQGNGLGRLLLRSLIDAAIAMDKHAIIAVIEAENAVSIALHASFGFERAALFRQVGYKFGRWLDLVFMQLTLDTPAEPVEGVEATHAIG